MAQASFFFFFFFTVFVKSPALGSIQQHTQTLSITVKPLEDAAAVFTSHIRNKYSFLKDIHIQNDENVFFLFIYLIFIYFYKIKKIYETKS